MAAIAASPDRLGSTHPVFFFRARARGKSDGSLMVLLTVLGDARVTTLVTPVSPPGDARVTGDKLSPPLNISYMDDCKCRFSTFKSPISCRFRIWRWTLRSLTQVFRAKVGIDGQAMRVSSSAMSAMHIKISLLVGSSPPISQTSFMILMDIFASCRCDPTSVKPATRAQVSIASWAGRSQQRPPA